MPTLSPLERWRLILGRQADEDEDIALDKEAAGMDAVLEALYDSERKGGLGPSSPNINRWLGDIRKYFPTPVVQLMQKDALERLNLNQLLLEPELLAAVEPDVHLAAVLLSLQQVLPDRSRETARAVIQRIVEDIRRRLQMPLQQAVHRALNRSARRRRPHNARDINWNQTILKNLKHYQPDLKTIIPEQIIAYGRKGRSLRHVILLVDQSGSMASSVVYAGVFGAILASLPSVKTHYVAFDTTVVDLTDRLHDPVDLLFGAQLGGGTDIHQALAYARDLVSAPRQTVLVLISDLFEGGNRAGMLKTIHALQQSGVRIAVLLALSDEGAPAYDHANAAALAAMDIHAFACTPDAFPDLLQQVLL